MVAKNVKVYLGADHGGFKAKEAIRHWLKEKGIEFEDVGTYSHEPVDYPTYAEKVAKAVAQGGEHTVGILACGTGIGMSMAANKVKGIRAAVCHDEFTAQMAREHNDANLLCLGERVVQTGGETLKIVQKFLDTPFSNEERHGRRVGLIAGIEGAPAKARKPAARAKKK